MLFPNLPKVSVYSDIGSEMEVDDGIKLTVTGGRVKHVVWNVEVDHRQKLDKMDVQA